MGEIDVYIDVKPPDLNLTKADKAFISTAIKAKLRAGIVHRSASGLTVFAYPSDQEAAISANVIAAMLIALGRPMPVTVEQGGGKWDKY